MMAQIQRLGDTIRFGTPPALTAWAAVAGKKESEGPLALALPAFAFDGEVHPDIEWTPDVLTVACRGWLCRYTAKNAVLADTGRMAANRNGHYRAFAAVGSDTLTVHIEIEKA